MTMIAGLKIDETPFLMGDFVISLPDAQAGRRRHRITKKTAILSANCAVAWTGSALSAGMVFDELFERFCNAEVRREEIEAYLTGREPDTQAFDVRLIVWVVEAEESLFLWSSASPGVVSEYEPIITGSGGDTFTDLYDRLQHFRFPQLGAMEKLGKAMMFYSELLTREIKTPDPSFGFGYEIAAFVDDRFSYLAKTLYCDIRADFSDPANPRTTHAKLFGSFIYDFEGEPNLTCLTWLDIYAKDVEIMLVTPPGSRSWIKRANDRWAERVQEDSNEIVRKLLGATALYCVRVTLQIGDRILRPIHFIYDCLSFGVIDPDRAVTVKLDVADGNIGLYVTFGQHFREFMLVRG